jgi:hypothetical protein
MDPGRDFSRHSRNYDIIHVRGLEEGEFDNRR